MSAMLQYTYVRLHDNGCMTNETSRNTESQAIKKVRSWKNKITDHATQSEETMRPPAVEAIAGVN